MQFFINLQKLSQCCKKYTNKCLYNLKQSILYFDKYNMYKYLTIRNSPYIDLHQLSPILKLPPLQGSERKEKLRF